MKWLSLFLTLASNTHVKSALISLAGVLGSLLTQAATGADLGTVGSATAAGVSAWLANLLQKLAPLLLAWLQAKRTGGEDTLDVSGLDTLAPPRTGLTMSCRRSRPG